ncbi:hypothetical protein ELS19_04475 [Halogeometricum borinquense]|uniref:Uncharacterized protein n=1 Tax=Halogeometricum borinquense TaxID=60847 RepID=A0A482T6C2_9EURY|nr:hypothetical protein [Halogeometricum borinquense]RYJ13294.1 hypothetical protein ELS19_04475 [Halogeometricum borinquense]
MSTLDETPYIETTLDAGNIIADCPECHDPMLLGHIWRELIDDGTIDTPPKCPDCDPEPWREGADPKIDGVEVAALAK